MTTLSPTKTSLKSIFINALRSGEYKQCFDVMKNTEGSYCAMGVFHAVNGDPDIDDMTLTYKFDLGVFQKITTLNDGGTDFNKIAHILESGLSEDLQSLSI